MQQEIFRLAMSQGIWAVLFVALLFYVLKENSAREQKYQEIIQTLTEKFQLIEEGLRALKEDVRDVKECIHRR